MFYHFLYPLKSYSIVFNIFRYITFRAIAASVTAFLICLILGPVLIRYLKKLSITNEIKRPHADSIHQFYAHKGDVPTMGGVLIVVSVLLSSFLWGNFNNSFFILCVVSLIGYCIVGFMDDWMKLKAQNSNGLGARVKLSSQVLIGLVLAFYLFLDPTFDKSISVPFLKNTQLLLGWVFLPFTVLVLVGTSNAINLTDGLDGLAVGCFVIAAGMFGLMTYVAGRIDYSTYLGITYIEKAGEMSVFCAALVGAGLGFLWFNSFPATIMMGDTGSLSLGGALATVAILAKKEIILLVVGGVFVWEALSVILQVTSFKLFKKRIFRMAPFHHHLQLIGWPESKVTIRLWIIAFILGLIGMSMLKLR
ncbi:MAG: phospho-N-acetylmuramoyl-pentapeptide-transferase [Candidatus Omnitrophica bacterium CG11_big_fil_rev_8_21_14_0_20_45_26]|uniref:Phospho-N-acetylmuramoyl-pentapeptide-transferase n=1 Tax=Candidatus Abzuiibacterium crystallinum TaxID=1974748 RepID=A0A2H0LPK7_9BACT|nr:MAG: phospho-N-acetylmuramoyl-pentapeptide-transferase [Candidatus Omnitrophica bacterium CG11_big_fil_rev_8_21_14_0_20_45_26]PIW64306.1 MAG: phospho-N-acetylmuramoyl-pentapeptide-transferase [Candidatus Omnitrophica bacterium CG12_big_fil_rev_8_21_14_0_65_45_16]